MGHSPQSNAKVKNSGTFICCPVFPMACTSRYCPLLWLLWFRFFSRTSCCSPFTWPCCPAVGLSASCLHILSISFFSVFSFWNTSFASCFLSFLHFQFFTPVLFYLPPCLSLVSTYPDCSFSSFSHPSVSPSLFTVFLLLISSSFCLSFFIYSVPSPHFLIPLSLLYLQWLLCLQRP